jgi:hypothetical protein
VNKCWRRHTFIEILADQALVVAPPSIHVKTGHPYEWVNGCSPEHIHAPAQIPDWVLWMPRITEPEGIEPAKPPRVMPVSRRRFEGHGSYSRFEVIAAMRPEDIQAEAASWGLRAAGKRPSSKGWLACHAIDREDSNPSAGINLHTGVYGEACGGRRISLFDLGVQLGAYQTWQDCCNALGERYGATKQESTRDACRPEDSR